VNGGDDAERLPSAIGPLVDLALHAYGRNVLLASLLSLAAFAVYGATELALPAIPDHALGGGLTAHDAITLAVALLGDSFITGVVALGVAATIGGTRLSSRTLMRGAAHRWVATFGATLFATSVVVLTAEAGGIGPSAGLDDLILAPVAWLLWGAVGLAGPIAALSPEEPLRSAFTSFGRSLTLSLRVTNLTRLCVVAFATIVPMLAQLMLAHAFTAHAVAGAGFWAYVPIDCIIIGPLTAIETVFALDFARRTATANSAR
jgi:hypothetical protein